MSTTRIAGGRAQASIDDGPSWPAFWKIDQELIYVRSQYATKPDPDWSLVDDAGHFHAFAEGDGRERLPTLDATAVKMPCDGSCGGVCEGGGYTVTRYTCCVCDQEITPRWIPDMAARTVGDQIDGMKDWEAEVLITDAPPPELGERVSVRLDCDDGRVRFGISIPADMRIEHDMSGTATTVTIAGVSPLGIRLAAAPVAAER